MSASSLPVVQPGSFLTLHYRLAGPAGEIVSTFGGQPSTLSLGGGQLSPALEDRLIGLPEGTHTTIELAQSEAFGEKKPELLQWVARTLLDEMGDPDQEYVLGDVVQFPVSEGQRGFTGVALQVREDGAVLFDFNHPLAGHPVIFEVKLIGIL
ncbi:FKBP-type peptidyl-prolyl cis-trans isomerase [Lampropedia hyalina]|jgi:FKBP-type peptidyl-prolyl cis-trans isomerase SlpA|uniref:FKBP-type peptidyl-prolyl cis-trans isomerase n=1 Tax=Lampropedia hyalina TaxID=198706 RepID=UPI000933F4B0|nr:FKBP-type peptidyl-prolyl cis-trans isomerase [Lampropedia hyalina]